MDDRARARAFRALENLRLKRLARVDVAHDDWALADVVLFGEWWVEQASREAEEAVTQPVRRRRA